MHYIAIKKLMKTLSIVSWKYAQDIAINANWRTNGKLRQGYILSPCLFDLYAEYIRRNAGLEEAQAGIKIAGRNVNNLRCADETTLMAGTEEELKSLLLRVKKLT